MAEETLDDRLSDLPDSILLQILSLLPTKEAFTTCILSKSWQYLWTSLDSELFHSGSMHIAVQRTGLLRASPRLLWRHST
ncbi:hypothetical protein RDI58_001482 [Solanum bulbocastanum]|uniref:F-box domain-containing protein n=1 Tax=Solanum bulbocastanum TaxID=147425 RepID=A0AAN8YN83_SOLBU